VQHQLAKCAGYWFTLVGIVALSLALPGCESGGGGDPWANFDFGSNNKNICVALGDSITAGSVLDSYAQCYIPKLAGMLQKSIINKAISGSETGVGADLVHSCLDTYHPGFLIILYGVNDLIMGYGEAEAVANLRYIVRAAKDNKTVPIIATLTPVAFDHVLWASGVKRLNSGIRQMADEEDVTVADLDEAMGWNTMYLLPDGLHPNPVGNDLMAATFSDVMK
jgi:lysophospholipase L1-like esterase